MKLQLVAFRASKLGARVLMRLMDFECGQRGESACAHLAFVRFVVVVRSHVRFQVIAARKRTGTNLTLILLLARMQYNMSTETASVFERFETNFALMWHLLTIHRVVSICGVVRQSRLIYLLIVKHVLFVVGQIVLFVNDFVQFSLINIITIKLKLTKRRTL